MGPFALNTAILRFPDVRTLQTCLYFHYKRTFNFHGCSYPLHAYSTEYDAAGIVLYVMTS